MHDRSSRHQLYVGEWLVLPEEGCIQRGDRSLRLQPKAMELLVHLADHAGRVVSKEQILEVVWAETLVEDGALTQCIHSLRKTLGDDSRDPVYIETIPRRGYRLLAPVRTEPPLYVEDAQVETATEDPVPSAKRLEPWTIALATVLIVLAFAAAWNRTKSAPPEPKDIRNGELNALQLTVASAQADSPGVVIKPLVVIAPRERQEDLSFVAQGLSQLIAQELEKNSGVRITTRHTTNWIVQNTPPMAELAKMGAGIDYLVEGSLLERRENELEIAISLVQVSEDQSVLKTTYLDSQSEVLTLSVEISEKLLVAMGLGVAPFEPRRLSDVPAATTAYLRGLSLISEPGYLEERVLRAAAALEQAVRLDPNFVLAHAELAKAYSWLYFNGERRYQEAARQALDRALVLDAELVDVRLASAWYHYRVDHDHQRAVAEFRAVARERPRDEETLIGMGYALRRQGKLREAIQYLEQIFVELDPKNAALAGNIAETYRALREHEQAKHWYENSLALDADQPQMLGYYALNEVLGWGCPKAESPCSTAAGWEIFDRFNFPHPEKLAYFYLLLDLYAAAGQDGSMKEQTIHRALDQLAAIPEELRDTAFEGFLFWRQGVFLGRIGETEKQRALAVRYRDVYSEKIQEAGDYSFNHAYLGIAHALLGEREAALAEGRLAVALAEARDAYSSPLLEQNLAIIHLLLGNSDDTFTILVELLDTPYLYGLTATELRLDPLWDPLRSDPRFTRLIAER